MARASSNFAPRLRRMLLMVPWLLESGGSTVTELAARFGVSEDDVVRDLNLVMCCGVPPYGAEQMITVVLDDDGSVLAWKGPFFTRPMRLTPTEGFAVLAAGRTLLAIPGADPSGPLSTALEKLERALGSSGRSVVIDLESPPLLGVVRAAVEATERIAVTHYSSWRDELTERTIDPLLVFSSDGRRYVSARDSLSGEVRHFRVDRFSTATATGERFTRPADAADRTARAGLLRHRRDRGDPGAAGRGAVGGGGLRPARGRGARRRPVPGAVADSRGALARAPVAPGRTRSGGRGTGGAGGGRGGGGAATPHRLWRLISPAPAAPRGAGGR